MPRLEGRGIRTEHLSEHGRAAGGPTAWRNHRVTITSPRRIAALALSAAFAIGACTSGGGATTAPTTAGSQAPASAGSAAPDSQAPAVSGSINVSGSSTVEPISTGVAESFAAANPDFKFTVKG